MLKISENWQSVNFDEIVSLYNSVNWFAYTKDKKNLLRAFTNSSYVLIVTDGEIVAAALRSMSDDVSIHYLQDILVRPTHQHSGLGRKLLNRAIERFSHVRTHMLLTDDEDKQHKFYNSLKYENVKTFKHGSLNAFVRINLLNSLHPDEVD